VTNGIGTLLVIRKPEHWVYRSTNAGSTWIRVAGDRRQIVRFSPLLWQIPCSRHDGRWGVLQDRQRRHRLGSYHGYGGDAADGDRATASDSLFVVADERGNWIESTDAGATWTSRSFPYAIPPVTSLLGVLQDRSSSVPRPVPIGSAEEDWRSLGIPGPVWDMMYRSGPSS